MTEPSNQALSSLAKFTLMALTNGSISEITQTLKVLLNEHLKSSNSEIATNYGILSLERNDSQYPLHLAIKLSAFYPELNQLITKILDPYIDIKDNSNPNNPNNLNTNIQNPIDINFRLNGSTPLDLALKLNNHNVAKILLNHPEINSESLKFDLNEENLTLLTSLVEFILNEDMGKAFEKYYFSSSNIGNNKFKEFVLLNFQELYEWAAQSNKNEILQSLHNIAKNEPQDHKSLTTRKQHKKDKYMKEKITEPKIYSSEDLQDPNFVKSLMQHYIQTSTNTDNSLALKSRDSTKASESSSSLLTFTRKEHIHANEQKVSSLEKELQALSRQENTYRDPLKLQDQLSQSINALMKQELIAHNALMEQELIARHALNSKEKSLMELQALIKQGTASKNPLKLQDQLSQSINALMEQEIITHNALMEQELIARHALNSKEKSLIELQTLIKQGTASKNPLKLQDQLSQSINALMEQEINSRNALIEQEITSRNTSKLKADNVINELQQSNKQQKPLKHYSLDEIMQFINLIAYDDNFLKEKILSKDYIFLMSLSKSVELPSELVANLFERESNKSSHLKKDSEPSFLEEVMQSKNDHLKYSTIFYLFHQAFNKRLLLEKNGEPSLLEEIIKSKDLIMFNIIINDLNNNNKDQCVSLAIKHNNEAVFEKMLSSFYWIHYHFQEGATALSQAMELNRTNMIESLLQILHHHIDYISQSCNANYSDFHSEMENLYQTYNYMERIINNKLQQCDDSIKKMLKNSLEFLAKYKEFITTVVQRPKILTKETFLKLLHNDLMDPQKSGGSNLSMNTKNLHALLNVEGFRKSLLEHITHYPECIQNTINKNQFEYMKSFIQSYEKNDPVLLKNNFNSPKLSELINILEKINQKIHENSIASSRKPNI